jgi:hypothetical protein
MSVKNFRFVSPGVFVDEIDSSQIPASPAGIGPAIIGRAEKGPALRPVTINSFEEFVSVFGAPSPGRGGSDVWRTGANTTATTYGAYAAQAYLKNSSPLTYVRLLGAESEGVLAAGGEAGWKATSNGVAWGLVVFEPEYDATDGQWVIPAAADATSTTAGSGTVQGALGAIFYTVDATTNVMLSGTMMEATTPLATNGPPIAASSVIIKDTGVPYEFKMVISNASGSQALTSSFNFNRGDSKYIRKVFNTNPQKTNSECTLLTDNYWLGETFDRHVKANITASTTWAAVIPLYNLDASALDGADHQDPLQSAQTPIIIGCDTVNRGNASSNGFDIETLPALFTVHALGEPGSWTNKNLKVSIQDIKASTNESEAYGSFSVVVRKLDDSDNVVKIVEQFENCSLNPDSLNYVARLVGDKSRTWVADERRYKQVGNYDNRSDFIRVAVASNVESYAVDATVLPFGFKGIVKYQDEAGIVTGSTSANWVSGTTVARGHFSGTLSSGSTDFDNMTPATGLGVLVLSGSHLTASILYPAPEFRVCAGSGNLANPTDAYFGMQTTRTTSSVSFDDSTIDLLMARGGIVGNMFAGASSGDRELSMYFTLDDLSGSTSGSKSFVKWLSGSHAAGTSLTNEYGAISGVLDQGFDRFTVPLYGGFDGLDIQEMDPFNNRLMNAITDINGQKSYTFGSIKRAMDALTDPEVVEMNLASMPALTQEGLTTHLMGICEDRADALAVIDLGGGFQPREDGTSVARNNTASSLKTVINNLRDRAINSSYGCAFYPWVRSRDTINGSFVWLPPSIAAMGTFSSSQRKTDVWFAPAGFNRGGLTEGAAGIPVVDVSHQLRRLDRDDLYSANINPIAKFPAEGIVIFGQKTLQVTQSALDRINVRRLMIFVKKRISQIAARLLFDPNAKVTWNRFLSKVNPFLASIQTRYGLSEFKVVLDETTTTPDLIDRNIMYAQIFLKPTRAIEFIAIDFNITRTGASFDD